MYSTLGPLHQSPTFLLYGLGTASQQAWSHLFVPILGDSAFGRTILLSSLLNCGNYLMDSDCLKPLRAPGPLPASLLDLGNTSKSVVGSPCSADVIANGWERFRAKVEPFPAALKKRSLLYSTEILILPRLCATDCQKGKSSSALHFSFLIHFCSSLKLLPTFSLATCISSSFLSLNLYWDISIFIHFLLPFPFSLQSSSKLHPFIPLVEWPMGTWGRNCLPGKVQKPRDLTVS